MLALLIVIAWVTAALCLGVFLGRAARMRPSTTVPRFSQAARWSEAARRPAAALTRMRSRRAALRRQRSRESGRGALRAIQRHPGMRRAGAGT